jgi:hypothetical protein
VIAVGLCSPGMSRAAISTNGGVLRHPGDLEWLERRRLQAAELFAQGKTKAEIASELGVSAQTTGRWYARWRDGGVAAMRTARQGKPAQLSSGGLAKIRGLLDAGRWWRGSTTTCGRWCASPR